ncbi:MAG: hypothetical protein EBR09_08245 [Proteobacteria bacterium]|nr:hypothetical protein [Pseudomonadota bacterium]
MRRICTISLPVICGFFVLQQPARAEETLLPPLTEDCALQKGNALARIRCEDQTADRFLDRTHKAFQILTKMIPQGARPALKAHQIRWELYADSWLSPLPDKPQSMRCSSPRAMLFQRLETLEKAVVTLKESKPKSLDLCYDNGACVEPGAVNGEMICETLFLGMEGVPPNAEPIVVNLLGQWTANGRPFETRINKSMGGKEPCETVSETALVEYVRGGYVTVRNRQGDTCNPQGGSEQLTTFDLRTGRALSIRDFTSNPKALLNLLRKQKEAEILQALLKQQIGADRSNVHIEPSECAQLQLTSLNEVSVHVTADGLRVNRLFKKPPRELTSCQFKVEEGLSPSTMGQLLRMQKNSPAAGLLRYIK